MEEHNTGQPPLEEWLASAESAAGEVAEAAVPADEAVRNMEVAAPLVAPETVAAPPTMEAIQAHIDRQLGERFARLEELMVQRQAAPVEPQPITQPPPAPGSELDAIWSRLSPDARDEIMNLRAHRMAWEQRANAGPAEQRDSAAQNARAYGDRLSARTREEQRYQDLSDRYKSLEEKFEAMRQAPVMERRMGEILASPAAMRDQYGYKNIAARLEGDPAFAAKLQEQVRERIGGDYSEAGMVRVAAFLGGIDHGLALVGAAPAATAAPAAATSTTPLTTTRRPTPAATAPGAEGGHLGKIPNTAPLLPLDEWLRTGGMN